MEFLEIRNYHVDIFFTYYLFCFGHHDTPKIKLLSFDVAFQIYRHLVVVVVGKTLHICPFHNCQRLLLLHGLASNVCTLQTE